MFDSPKIFVISLKNSSRRQNITKQLTSYQIDFEFFDAIDGLKGHALFKHYNSKKRLLIKGYPMTAGELGCFASHYLLWEKCIKINQPIIIIEDHAKIFHVFLKVIQEFNKLTKEEGFYKLYSGAKPSFKVVKQVSNLAVVKFTSKTNMTTGYIITPKAAELLICHAEEWVEPVDDYMDREWQHHIPKYGVYPYSLARKDIPSEIGNRTKRALPLLTKLRREVFALPDAIRKFLFFRKL